MTSGREAIRAVVTGDVQGVGFRDATVGRARELRVMGWVRNGEVGSVQVHAEGDLNAVAELVAFLHEGPQAARVAAVEIEKVSTEGHEQFAIRGVSAGRFVVGEYSGAAHRFDLRLEIGRATRSWTIPKGPSLDPGVRRFAFEGPPAASVHDTYAGALESSAAIVWDRGSYEQGGRVAWPQALDRGHAVFVLHGEKLSGGFALQRTRPGAPAQWLLIKRRDQAAGPGSDIVAQRPGSVLTGQILDEL